MDYYEGLDEVILSWERCIQKGVQNKNCNSGLFLKNEELDKKFEDSKQIISTFDFCIDEMKDLLTNNLFFISFVSADKFLLKKKAVARL
jgi:transcriptional regulator of acetoin/glycerol metabolism